MWKTARLAASSGKVGVCDEQASLSIGAVGTPAGEGGLEFRELVDNLSIALDTLVNTLAGVQDGGVVASAEGLAELLEGDAGQIAGEMDRHVAGPGDACGPALRAKVLDGDAVVGGDGVLDVVDRGCRGRPPGLDLVEH